MSAVRVAAVVTAHDRREFLADAVRSALEGGADEVVVVRNFDGPIPGYEGRYTNVRCDPAETNEKEARGLEAATADVVGFLDDDDRWTPDKVALVRSQFDGNPDLVYLCHAQRPIDADGRPVTATHRELASVHPERFPSWDGQDFEGLVRGIWPGNNSSTVVRRGWALEWLPTFREAGWSADIFWLVAALASRRTVRVLPDALTELRLHTANMSQTRGSTPEQFRERHRTTCERFARSNAVLARVATERLGPKAPMTRYLSEKAEGYRFFADLEAGPAARRAALRALTHRAGRHDRAVFGTSVIALVSPASARRALYRSSLRRWSLA